MENIGPLITIFLLFALVGGIVIIYQEEIQKAEFFGRLQTTAVPGVEIQPGTTAPVGKRPGAATTPGSFTENRQVRFGNGRIVDSSVRDIEIAGTGTALHTIVSGVSGYYARGFLEETKKIYRPSPHAGSIIFLDRVSGVKESRPDREYFILLTANNLREPIPISGWKIFDRKGKTSYRLPKGVKVLGTSGGIQKRTEIRVGAGESIIVSSGRSPIGQSFRVNKCSGYRSQFKKFTPTIKTNCPKPSDEFESDASVPYTDTECAGIVDRLARCTAVTVIPKEVSRQCQDFLKKIVTERGCIARHRNDPDFFTSEWRMFLGSDEEELWANKDNVLYLLDGDNLLVATLVYR